METGIIYKVTSPSGRCYIGQTSKNFDRRKSEHVNEANRNTSKEYNLKFHNAIRKYGDQLKWEILKDNIAEDKLNLEEILAIYLYDSYYDGYNSTLGGEGNRGYIFTEEDKSKLSESSKHKVFSESHRKNLSNALLGNKRRKGIRHSEETKSIMSSQRKDSKHPMFGKHHSEETKLKISNSRKRFLMEKNNE